MFQILVYFLCKNCKLQRPGKSHPPLSQQPPLEDFVGGSPPPHPTPPPPAERGEGAHYVNTDVSCYNRKRDVLGKIQETEINR